jgi:hypothetical protein
VGSDIELRGLRRAELSLVAEIDPAQGSAVRRAFEREPEDVHVLKQL